MPKEYDISTIEQYLSGEMPEQDRSGFERVIQEDEELKTEIAAYQSLFIGFKALQEETFASQLEQWNQEWEDIDQEEITLIEAYHQGALNPELHQQMEERIVQDSTFAQKVKEYQNLLSGFEGLQSESFSEKMTIWASDKIVKEEGKKEAKVRSLRPVFTRIAIAASFLLLLGIGMNWYANQNYGTTQLISNYYKAPTDANLMGDKAPEASQINSQFKKAHTLLQQGSYQEAYTAFEQLEPFVAAITNDPFNKTYFESNIEWNKALAALGGAKSEEETLQLLENIRNNPKQEHQSKAEKLLQQMRSFWRKLN